MGKGRIDTVTRPQTSTSDTNIRPFRVNVPEEQLADLRRRIAATRWPERETVADESQGVQLSTMQELVRYWGTEYDFRRWGISGITTSARAHTSSRKWLSSTCWPRPGPPTPVMNWFRSTPVVLRLSPIGPA